MRYKITMPKDWFMRLDKFKKSLIEHGLVRDQILTVHKKNGEWYLIVDCEDKKRLNKVVKKYKFKMKEIK